jgi:hypothetical protein
MDAEGHSVMIRVASFVGMRKHDADLLVCKEPAQPIDNLSEIQDGCLIVDPKLRDLIRPNARKPHYVQQFALAGASVLFRSLESALMRVLQTARRAICHHHYTNANKAVQQSPTADSLVVRMCDDDGNTSRIEQRSFTRGDASQEFVQRSGARKHPGSARRGKPPF